MQTQVYIHQENNKEVLTEEVNLNSPIKAAFSKYLKSSNDKLGKGDKSDVFVYLEDSESPLDETKKCDEAGIKVNSHVHFHRCKSISVVIEYNGRTVTVTVSPATTASKLLKIAGEKFTIGAIDLADLRFKVSDGTYSGTYLEPKNHIGSYVSHSDCKITLSLEPKTRIQG